jgi:hypothetical protein
VFLRSLRGVVRLFSYVAIGVTMASCTLVSDFDVHACRVDSDCDAVVGQITRCEDGLCASGCRSNAQCEAFDPRTPLCNTAGRVCVGFGTSNGECFLGTALADELGSSQATLEDAIVIGTFAPTLRSSEWLTVQLAVDELNSLGGLPSERGTKQVLGVLCDGSRATVAAAIDHLVTGLSSRAILASLEDESLRIALEHQDANGPLFLSPNSSDSWSASLAGGDPPFLWYLGPDYRDLVAAYSGLVARAHSSLVMQGRDPSLTRVATVVSEAKEDHDLADAVESEMELGGSLAYDLRREYRLLRFGFESAEDLESLLNFGPDIVLFFVGGVRSQSPYSARIALIRELEAIAREASWRPIYVFGPRNADDRVLAQLAFEDSDFRSRAIGVRGDRVVDDAVADSLRQRFASAFPSQDRLPVSLGVYDALYYLAYAVAATPGHARASQGASVDGMSRVTDSAGESVAIGVGITGLEKATELLSAGDAFDLHGTTGPAAFDAGHVRAGPPRAYCWLESGRVVDFADLSADGANGLAVSADCGTQVLGATD